MGEDFFEGKGVVSKRRDSMEKAIKALAKIPEKSWKAMEGSFTAMADFAAEGGMVAFMGGTLGAIKSRIETSVTGMFAPLINEITQLASDVLVEFMPMIDGIVAGISTLIQASKDFNITVGETDISLWDAIITGLSGLPIIIMETIRLIGDAFNIFKNEFPENLSEWLGIVIDPEGLPAGGPFETPSPPGEFGFPVEGGTGILPPKDSRPKVDF